MAGQAPQPLQTPPGAVPTPAKNAPSIFVMPEAYRHGAKPMAQPKPAATPPAPVPVVVAPPPPPKPPAPTGKPVPVRRKSSHKGMLVLGLAFLLLLGVGGYFLVRSVSPVPVATPELTPQPTPEPTPTPEPQPEPVPAGPIAGSDQDGDGLTDLEEQAIYGSDATKPDTDADGYIDSLEVANRYNPAAVAPKTLFEAGVVKPYDGGTFSMLYPAAWSASENAGIVTFVAATGETVTLRPLSAGESIPSDAVPFTTKNGLSAYRVAAVPVAYFVDIPGRGLSALTTGLGIKASVDYAATVDMMVGSMMAKAAPQP